MRSWKEFFLEASSDDVAANIIAAWSAGGTAQGLVAFSVLKHIIRLSQSWSTLKTVRNAMFFWKAFQKKTSFGVRSGECAFRKLSLDFLFMLWKIKATQILNSLRVFFFHHFHHFKKSWIHVGSRQLKERTMIFWTHWIHQSWRQRRLGRLGICLDCAAEVE